MPEKIKQTIAAVIFAAAIIGTVCGMCWCSNRDMRGSRPQSYKYRPIQYSAQTVELQEIADNTGGN